MSAKSRFCSLVNVLTRDKTATSAFVKQQVHFRLQDTQHRLCKTRLLPCIHVDYRIATLDIVVKLMIFATFCSWSYF
jgi:hypothetical protein